MDTLKLRRTISIPFFVFLGSYVALVLFFSQQNGHILWENMVASAIFAAVLAFFTFLCTFSKWVFFMWLLGTISFLAISLAVVLDWNTFTLDYLYGTCYVSFYCLNQAMPTWVALLISVAFQIIFLIDILFGFILGLRTLLVLNSLYPQTKYFLGTFITGFFILLFSLIQMIRELPPYTSFQLGLLFLFTTLTLASLCFGIFYKKMGSNVDKFKRIYGAAVMAFIFLLPLLVPFDTSSADDQKAAFIGRLIFSTLAIFVFIYFGFFAKLQVPQGLDSCHSIRRSKNKRSRH